MATRDRMARLARELADAEQRLARAPTRPTDDPAGPGPGDLYVFGAGVEAAIEWLVVRFHPDDPALVLLAPADDFPLAGRADVPLEDDGAERPLTVRCGESAWLPAPACRAHLRVGFVPEEGVARVRRALAALARGRFPGPAGAAGVEADPEYAAWLEQVAKAREAIEQRGGSGAGPRVGTVLRFERGTASLREFAEEPQAALAAEPGGELLAALAASVASGGPRFLEVPLSTGGTLLLADGATGVRVAWKGPIGAEPPALSAAGQPDRVVARWHPGEQAGVHRADPIFPWVDGEVALLIGTENPEPLTVRL